MAQQHYPLAPSTLGESRLYAVEDLDQGQGWNIAASPEGMCPVWLHADFATGGWKVRTAAGPIGRVDAETRQEYSQVERVMAAGHAPQTIAQATVAEDNTVELEVWFPLPALAIPLNNLPAEVPLLPQGQHWVIDTSSSADLPEEINHLTAQVLVTLSDVDGATVVAYGQEVLGTIDMPLPSSPLGARAFIADGSMVVDATADLAEHSVVLPQLQPLPTPPAEENTEEDIPEVDDILLEPDLGGVPQGPRPLTGPAEDKD